MKRFAAVLVLTCFALAPAALAAEKTYQVTGPIISVDDAKIVVEGVKDKEKYEIARTKDTKVTGDLKVGTKVTIQYSMTATSIEAKAEKAPAKAPKKK